MHKLDIASLLSIIVGVGALATDAGFAQYVATLFGPHAPQVLAGLGFAGLIASQAVRIIGAPSQSPSGSSDNANPPQAALPQKD